MTRNQFNDYISKAQFYPFFNELGWDNVDNQSEITIPVGDVDYELKAVVQKSGFIVYVCEVNGIPQNAFCKQLDIHLRRYSNDYILIFREKNTQHQLWIAPIKTVEKRDLVTLEYATASQTDFLFSKLNSLSFELDEEVTIVDVTSRIHTAFEINSAKITKDFYTGFKKQHTSFLHFIRGIEVESDKQWYVSVMLNRLMFCYFIQKKGFLNFDSDYLRHKLEWTQEQKGENKFFGSFYKGFLCILFHGGLNAPQHNSDFEKIYGRIPYLNGGLFDEHSIETQYKDIDIEDKAFEYLFDFFDKWRWHLDTRITASGKDINPDVLGYIFEQYINDRAQMGAYYTKEDITEYIGKSCILPFLMDEVAKTTSKKHFEPTGYIWQTLKQSEQKYIYDAVKKGYGKLFPEEIAQGIDTQLPNLLERRSDWNKPASEEFALPTEIWRETIERLQRCKEIIHKIATGEITQINDFITYNLDIRSFVEDLLKKTDDHLFIKHFYHALQKVTILDPTCGSGAFLFAALNILEPLYEVCIFRMQEFHDSNPILFKDEMREIESKYRSNIQYFIYKSIILRNLYGVDIMAEATEIAKLRLFLKMVAVVDVNKRADNLGLDPLPDVDFNIRCGNTLIGYATKKELDHDLTFGDIFANQKFKAKVEEGMEKVAMAYERFKDIQLTQHDDIESFKNAKIGLSEKLIELNEVLNKRLYTATTTSISYAEWLKLHQPFHWLAEFYEIVHKHGGFDVIIGNPPYVEYAKVKKDYQIKDYETESCGNLYAFVIERSNKMLSRIGFFGMIVPVSIVCTDRTETLQKFIKQNYKRVVSSFDIFPAKIFEGAAQRVAILILKPKKKEEESFIVSKYYRWFQLEREHLMTNLSFVHNEYFNNITWSARISKKIEIAILKKINHNKQIGRYINSSSYSIIYAHRIVNNFFKAVDFEPYFKKGDGTIFHSDDFKIIHCDNEVKPFLICILNSNLFYWYWRIHGDGFHCGFKDIEKFPCDFEIFSGVQKESMDSISDKLNINLKTNSQIRKRKQQKTGTVELQTFFVGKSKHIIDEIDKVLAQHYGFTEEELDFIINYDIKYRMGAELNEE